MTSRTEDLLPEAIDRDALVFLLRLDDALADAVDPGASLRVLVRNVLPRLGDFCVADVVDRDGRAIFADGGHVDPARHEALLEYRRRYPPGPANPRSPVQRVLETGEPYVAFDVARDDPASITARNAEQARLLEPVRPTSMMVLPLRGRGRVLGALGFAMTSADRRFGPADLALAQQVATRAAATVERALLHDERQRLSRALRRQQAATAELSAAVLSAPLDVLERSILETVARLLDVEYASLFELEEGGTTLLLRAAVGWRDEEVGRLRLQLDHSQAGYTLQLGEPVVVEELARETRFRPSHDLLRYGTRSGMSVPVPGERGAFGVLGAHSRSLRRYRAEDVEFMKTAAAALGAAIERKRHEDRIARQASFLQALLDHLPDVVVRLDREHRMVYVNPAIARFQGAPGELIGRRISEFAAVNGEAAAWEDRIERAFTTGEAQELEVELHLASGRTLSLDARMVPERDERGTVGSVLVAVRDMTWERRTAATRLENQQREAALAKLQALTRMAAAIAHDFNNALTVILAFSDMLARGVVDAAEAGRPIMAATRRAADLTRQLLAYSNGTIEEPEAVDLASTVDEVVDDLQDVLGDGVELTVRIADGLPPVRAHRTDVEEILRILATNAAEAMPKGGQVALSIERTADGSVRLSFTDDGTGMDADTLAHAFEPFFTTRQLGRGLGLATVDGAMRGWGGAACARSEIGKGTTIELVFPAFHPVEGPGKQAGAAPARPAPERPTVLLVEDERLVRRASRRALEAHGFAVLEAAHGREAIDVAKRHAGPIDALVTDVVMPDMSGPEVARVLHVTRPDVPVLFVSGYAPEGLGDLDGGRFLPKPFAPQTLADAVRELIAG